MIDGWAMVELMGHRQRVGRIQEVEVAGAKMVRVDIPTPDGSYVTEFYGSASLYAIRPCTEEIARAACAERSDPRPARPLEYRPQLTVANGPGVAAGDDPNDERSLYD